jgi:O-antigen ligase
MYRSRYILPEAWQEPNLSHPHNIVLDFLSRLGLLGFAAGAAMMFGFWQAAVRATRRLRTIPTLESANLPLLPLAVGFMGAVADMVAHGLVDHSFFLVDLAYVFFLALAAIQHIDRLSAQPGSMPAPAAAAPVGV